MSEVDILQVQIIDNALMVTLNRPRAMNALTTDSIAALHALFNGGYREYGDFAGVVITGAEQKAFAAGADISGFAGLDATGGEELSRKGHEAFNLIERFHVPVIAAVNGFALGGGCELALSCHLRIASDNARFGQPEVNLGLIPGYGGTQRLVQCIGKTRATELLLTGDMITAEEALQLGLVNAVVDQADLLDTCFATINKIAAKGPLAVRRIISCVNAYFEEGTNGFETEIALFSELMGTDDVKEGTTAFLEKRKPDFRGK